jgi:hypothetical protein
MHIDRPPTNGQPSFRVNAYPTRDESPEPISTGGSAVHSVHQSPAAVPVPPKRYADEDYDDGVAVVLMNLASYRTHVTPSQPLLIGPPRSRFGRLTGWNDRSVTTLSGSSMSSGAPSTSLNEEFKGPGPYPAPYPLPTPSSGPFAHPKPRTNTIKTTIPSFSPGVTVPPFPP